MPRLSQRQTLLNPLWVEKLLSHDTFHTANHLEDQRDFRLSSRIPHTRRELVDSPGAGTQVCRKLLPPLPSSPCCVSAGPACRTPTRRTKWGEALTTLTNFSSWNVKEQHRKMYISGKTRQQCHLALCVALLCCFWAADFILRFFFTFLLYIQAAYLEEVTGGDEERRVLLLVFCTLLGQRRQSLQTQLADLWTHPGDRH